jgi:hypothetical protein
MRFMMLYKPGRESDAPPTQKEMAEMGQFIEEMAREGVLLSTDGLQPSSKGSRVRITDGKFTVIDGPFTETKELVAGFMIIKVKSLAEAIEWVKRAPNVSSNGEGEVEIRKLMDVEDFGEGFTPNPEIAKVKFK